MRGEFAEVFGRLEFEGGLDKVFGGAEVESLELSRKDRLLSFSLRLRRFISDANISNLKRQLLRRFPFLRTVNVDLNYSVDGDKTSRLSLYWPVLLDEVNSFNPACGAALSRAKYELTECELAIRFAGRGAFAFSLIKADRYIEKLLADKLGLSVKLRLIDSNKNRKAGALLPPPPNLPPSINQNMPYLSSNAPATPQKPASPAAYKNTDGSFKPRHKKMKLSKQIAGVVTKLDDELIAEDEIICDGEIFGLEKKETKSGLLLFVMEIWDYNGSITAKFFLKPEKFDDDYKKLMKIGSTVRLSGKLTLDDFSKEITLMANEIAPSKLEKFYAGDTSDEKRVELHLHTKMSQTDAVTSITDYVNRAKEWGHGAIGLTDHGVLQAYPEAMDIAKKTGVKILYGVEAYLVDDIDCVAKLPKDYDLCGEFVVYDLETTGLKKEVCEIIEIGAVRIINGEITDRFSAYIKPRKPIPQEITDLTGITNEMVRDGGSAAEVLPRFLEFIGGAVLAAHNAEFDIGFLAWHLHKLGLSLNNSWLCTVELCKAMYPELTKFKLNLVAQHLKLDLKNHHRAVDDAECCAAIFLHARKLLLDKNRRTLRDINDYARGIIRHEKSHSNHAIIFVKNYTGLRNLYELVSEAHLNHFYHRAKIYKSELIRLRDGLILGSACEAGELFQALVERRPQDMVDEICRFYDYLEIQPISNNMFMALNGTVDTQEDLKDFNRRIAELGEMHGKPVCATTDCHFLDRRDEVLRKLLSAGKGFEGNDRPLPLYFRSTDEMLAEFAYLGADKAREVVITNTQAVADQIESILPIPNGTFPPEIPGSEEQLSEMTYKNAKALYGDPLPAVVSARLERELGSIISNGFAVMYIIAQKLVQKSVSDGYLVGSRGSVGSSFAATMAGITEVNPLSPHYYCQSCKYSDFESELVLSFSGGSGCDLPDRNCPNCGMPLKKEGHDIPFETFLGFNGDKEPDIDLNFSGEYQAKAHAYTEELFGKGHVFKAGTIGTLASKTAYGYVKKYYEEKGIKLRKAEENRLTAGLTGVKKTTGQHPGGLVVVPNGRSIYEFCPVQHPADDAGSDIVTTHFDYHSISGRLLKLDILGHDVPTIIRQLHDITGLDPTQADIGDPDVVSLFISPKALGVTEEQINSKTGTLGLPEFGTHFVRQMLIETRPTTFAELVRISGLSHGTNVWTNNAQEIIKAGQATLKDIIPCRDDIMLYLMQMGVEKLSSFKIMENVRKGKGLTEQEESAMRDASVPEWYINSCKKIEYLFPKGHAVAYVMMTVRIGWYKLYQPLAFYAASFSVKAADFDYNTMCLGKEKAREEQARLLSLGNERSAKDDNSLSLLELVIEMYERGLSFAPLSIYNSHHRRFEVEDGKLLPPLCTIAGLGENAAERVVQAREDGEFFSIEELKSRTKLTKSVIEILRGSGALDGMSETDQLTIM